MKWICTILLMLMAPSLVFSLEVVSVAVEPDQYAVAGKPVDVSVMVTHRKTSKVDISSFKLDGKSLKVEFLKEIQMSEQSNLVISIYQFTVEAKKKGLYTLKPVSVRVNGIEYTSLESSYGVD